MDKTTENPDIINERFNLLKLYGRKVHIIMYKKNDMNMYL